MPMRLWTGWRNRRVVRRVAETRDSLTEVQNAVRQGMLQYLKALRLEARAATIKKNKTGRIYVLRQRHTSTRAGRRAGLVRTHRRSRKHRASAPGESFASRPVSYQGGELRKSISFKLRGWNRGRFGYAVARKSQELPRYAKWIEEGTPKGQMKARPALKNAIDEVDGAIHFEAAYDEWANKQAKKQRKSKFARARRRKGLR